MIVEMVKRLMGCYFVYRTTDRGADKSAYTFRPLESDESFVSFLGLSHWKPRLGVKHGFETFAVQKDCFLMKLEILGEMV